MSHCCLRLHPPLVAESVSRTRVAFMRHGVYDFTAHAARRVVLPLTRAFLCPLTFTISPPLPCRRSGASATRPAFMLPTCLRLHRSPRCRRGASATRPGLFMPPLRLRFHRSPLRRVVLPLHAAFYAHAAFTTYRRSRRRIGAFAYTAGFMLLTFTISPLPPRRQWCFRLHGRAFMS